MAISRVAMSLRSQVNSNVARVADCQARPLAVKNSSTFLVTSCALPGLGRLIGIPLAIGRYGELKLFAIRRGLTEAVGREGLRVEGAGVVDSALARHDVVHEVERQEVGGLRVAACRSLAHRAIDQTTSVVAAQLLELLQRHLVIDVLGQEVSVRGGELMDDLVELVDLLGRDRVLRPTGKIMLDDIDDEVRNDRGTSAERLGSPWCRPAPPRDLPNGPSKAASGSTSSSRFGSGRFKDRFGSPVALEIVASVDGRSERGTGPVACSSRGR